LQLPLVVKPAWEGSSKGIRNRCLIRDVNELPDVVAALRRAHPQTILIEEYIAGDEVTVGILGNDPPSILGMMQIAPLFETEHFIYSLELKRDYQGRLSFHTPPVLPRPVIDALGHAALTAFRTLHCRDVARIDFRVKAGVPYFLEVNPLPGLHPIDSDLVLIAGKVGWSYERLVATILQEALQRCAV
jgi:D-alanine-D-alanine ligase